MNEIQQLQEQHREVLRLAALGYPPREIANTLKWKPTQVKELIGSDLGQKEIARLGRLRETQYINLREQVDSTARWGATFLDETLRKEDTPTRVRIKIAQDAINTVLPKSVGSNLHIHMTPEQLIDIKRRAREEIPYEEVPTNES